MATFRIHLSSDPTQSPVANLITGIGQMASEEGTGAALILLHSLENEIAFVKRYILDRPASAPIDFDAMRKAWSEVDAPKREFRDINSRVSGHIADIRKNAGGTAIHP